MLFNWFHEVFCGEEEKQFKEEKKYTANKEHNQSSNRQQVESDVKKERLMCMYIFHDSLLRGMLGDLILLACCNCCLLCILYDNTCVDCGFILLCTRIAAALTMRFLCLYTCLYLCQNLLMDNTFQVELSLVLHWIGFVLIYLYISFCFSIRHSYISLV